MIRAAFLAFGAAVLAIVDDAKDKDDEKPRLVLLESRPTVQTDAARIVALLSLHKVARVVFDLTLAPPEAVQLVQLVRVMSQSVGIETDDVSREARLAKRRLVRTLKDWPDKPSVFDVQAAAMVLADMEPKVATKPAPLAAELAASVASAENPSPGIRGKGFEPDIVANLPPSTGRKVIAIDPGSAWLGVVVAQGDAAPLHVLHRQTIEVGRVVKLARAIKRGARTYYEDRVLDWTGTPDRPGIPGRPGVVDLATQVAAIALEHGATVAIVERSPFVFGRATRDLVRAAEVGAVVADRLRAHGLEVTRESAPVARARVTKGAKVKGESRDNAVGRAVAEGYRNWPAKGDTTHERDAALLALFAATPPPVPVVRVKPARTAPVKDARDRRGRSRPERAARNAAAKVERGLAGCSCPGKHRRDCPLFKPKASAKV